MTGRDDNTLDLFESDLREALSQVEPCAKEGRALECIFRDHVRYAPQHPPRDKRKHESRATTLTQAHALHGVGTLCRPRGRALRTSNRESIHLTGWSLRARAW